jgi:phage terminase large subunit-like protein
VNASRGKSQRAEPVATLYTEGMVVHVGTFVELEAEQTGWAPGDPWSPNRLDWLVWAVTELMLEEKRVSPRVHFPGMGEKKTA